MASNIYAIKCPCCGRSAIEDYYYKTGEQYTNCLRCGYNYSKTMSNITIKRIEYREEKYEGNGVYILVNKEGNRKNMMLNSITDEQLEKYKASFLGEDVNQEKSNLVFFEDGVFTILQGNPPENFYLSFEEYREINDFCPIRS